MPHHFHIEEKRRMICILAALSIIILLVNGNIRHFLPRRHHGGGIDNLSCGDGTGLVGCGDAGDGGEGMGWLRLKEWL